MKPLLMMIWLVMAQASPPATDSAPAVEAPSSAVETAPTESSESEAPAAETPQEPAPYPQEYTKTTAKEKKEQIKKALPQKYGDCSGESWVGQRTVTEHHAGWGWLKREGETWRSAKWVMLEETPDVAEAPSRFYAKPDVDDKMQYRLYGEFAAYKGYEPNVDALVAVFVLKGFEVIGPGDSLPMKPPGPSGARKGRIAERGSGMR